MRMGTLLKDDLHKQVLIFNNDLLRVRVVGLVEVKDDLEDTRAQARSSQ